MPEYKKKHDRKCGAPAWSTSNISKFNSENGEFVDYQSRAECSSYWCARCIVRENILKSLGLKVKLPMVASIDNSRVVDIGNN